MKKEWEASLSFFFLPLRRSLKHLKASRHFPKKEGILAFSGGSGFVGTS